MTEEIDYGKKCIFNNEVCWRYKEKEKYMKEINYFDVGSRKSQEILFCLGCKLTDIDGLLSDWYEHKLGSRE